MGSFGVTGYHNRASVSGPGVTIGRSGASIGIVSFVEVDYWPLNTCLYVKNFLGNNPQFIYYFLNTLNLSHYNSGSAQPSLNRNYIYPIIVRFPERSEQDKIVDLLAALDDKVELNRRANATLEAMARALFKDWFVDFGPTRAKMAGAPPYLAPDLWNLFPPTLDEQGVPTGWERRPLDQIAEFLNGLALQKYPAQEGQASLPVIKIAEMRGGISSKSNRASLDVPEKYVVKNGDFIFSWSGSLMAKFWTEGQGALNQHLFKVTSANYPSWLYSLWVQHYLEEFQAIAASKATTMGHIQRSHLKAAMTVCPTRGSLKRFNAVVSPLINQTIRNQLESRSLAATRDLLLPKLMSGEIRVKDAEVAAAEAL